MQVIISSDPQSVADRASLFIKRKLEKNPQLILGLSTGSTPLKLYQKLINLYKKQLMSFKTTTTFNLDEYIGLASDHPQSYHYFMKENFFKHIDINLTNTYIPQCNQKQNPFLIAETYEENIKQCGGIDLQILGIGRNGHIGFNEPSSSLSSKTRIKTLTKETIADNSRFFKQGEFQPIQAITMGMQTILAAKMIILLATGKHKAEAVQKAVEGPVSASCPASLLQFHQHTVFLIDEDASSQLKNKSYYYHVDDLTQKIENLYRLSDI